MAELCMNCFSVKGQYKACPFCGYIEGTPPKQPHYLTPGTILGEHFIVGTVIGAGGFGITYKCFDMTLGVTVAVKEFYPVGLVNRSPGEKRVGLLSGDRRAQYKERLRRFLMEAQSIAQFGKARDIVNVYDFFEENGTAYIIMEYIDGVLLKDYLEKQGVIPQEAAMSIIMPIIDAVKKIHSKGIIHRDVSPDNIFIASEDSIKIFDFGAARLNDSKEGRNAEPVIKVGYSPLEQYRDKSKQGFYTDVYSVGAIFYQMLTGVIPLESTEREFKDRMKSPKELGIKVSDNVDRAIMEALAVRPELRFQSIQHFEEALLNKRIAEYPKDKLRKMRRGRNMVIGLTALLAAAVGIGAGLYSTVLKPKNRIFDTTLSGETEILVWVENKTQKAQIEDLVENGFRKGNTTADSEKVQAMQKDNEKVTVVVEVKENMEKALHNAKEDGRNLPNMFLSDHVSDVADYDPVSMEDNVYDSLKSNLDDYLFMSEYETIFPDMKEMPTGIDTLLLYACQIDYNKDNKLDTSIYLAAEDSDKGNADSEEKHNENTVELTELVALTDAEKPVVKRKLNTSLAVFEKDSIANALLLQNEEWTKTFDQTQIPYSEDIKTLTAIRKFNNRADKAKYSLNRKKKIYGSNIVSGVAFRMKMNDAMKSEHKMRANPLNSYKTFVVTHDNKMLVELSERYVITGESSDEQATACMRLLWVMMSDTGQSRKTAPGETTYPILRSQFEEFTKYNANYGSFIELVKNSYECSILVDDISGDAWKFISGLGEADEQETIEAYCSQYVSGQPPVG